MNHKNFPGEIDVVSIYGCEPNIFQNLQYFAGTGYLSSLNSTDGVVTTSSAQMKNHQIGIYKYTGLPSSKSPNKLPRDFAHNFSGLDEPDNSSYEIDLNKRYHGHVNPKGNFDIDNFEFKTNLSGNLNLTIYSLSQIGAELELIDKNTNTILHSLETSSINEELTLNNLFIQPGTYILKITSSIDNSSNQVVSYGDQTILYPSVSNPDSYYFDVFFEEFCPYENLSIVLNDSWGDGWSGANLDVNLAEFTLENGNTDTVNYCFNSEECLYINTSNDDYPDEVSWEIIDTQDNILLSGGTEFFGNIGYCENQSDCDQLLNFEIITGNNFETLNWTVTDQNNIEAYSSNNEIYDFNSSYLKYLCLNQGNQYSLNFEYSGNELQLLYLVFKITSVQY